MDIQKVIQPITKSIWEQLIKVFQNNSYISQYKEHEINFISKFQTTGEQEQQISKFQSHYNAVIRLKNNQQAITMEIYGVGKIEKSMLNSKYLDVARKINNSMCQDDVIYWVEENSNFAVRKIINCQYLRQTNILQIRNYLTMARKLSQQTLRKSFAQLRENEELKSISQSPNEIKKINLKQQQSLQQQQSKKKAKCLKVRLKKKFIGLEHLKYQFEVNRRKNTKSTNLDFNNYKLKSLNDILNLQQYCTQNNKSYIYALRQNYSKSQINAPEAQKNYLQLLETYHRKKQNKSSKSGQENMKILNSIGIRSQISLKNDKIQATFSHIQIVQSNYVTYLSTRQAVNQHITASQLTSLPFSLSSSSQSTSSQNSENNYTRQSTNILVKKNKCPGCVGQTQERRKINQLVFQNQKQILLIFLDRYHPSICSYLIKQFDKKQEVKQIYSKMLPHMPIDIYFNSSKISSPVKFLKNALKFLLQVSEGISFLYSSQIAHRDLKPTNIMLNENLDVKIIDFGSACTFFNSDVGLTQQFDYTLRSSPGYYCKYIEIPQEVRGKYTQQQFQRHRNFDVYSFGVITEKLCERIPKFSSFYFETMIQNLNYLIRKCKDTNPDDRITPGQIVLFLNELSSSARIMEDNV